MPKLKKPNYYQKVSHLASEGRPGFPPVFTPVITEFVPLIPNAEPFVALSGDRRYTTASDGSLRRLPLA